MAEVVALAIAGVFGSVLFVRVAGADFYGQYLYVFSLSVLGSLIMLPGFNSALVNSAANNTHGDFATVLRFKLRFYPGYVAFFFFVSLLMYFFGKGKDISLGFLLVGVIGGWQYVINGYSSYFVGIKDYTTSFWWNLLLALSVPVGAISYLIVRKSGYIPLSVALIVAVTLLWQSLVQLAQYFHVNRLLANNVGSSGLKKYSINLSFMSLLGGAQSHLDQFVVGLFLNYSALTYYSLAKRVFGALSSVFYGLQKYIQPRLAGSDWASAKKYFRQYLQTYAVIVPGLIAVYLLLPYFFEWVYGAEYILSAEYAQLLVLVILLDFPNFYIESYLRARQSYRDMWIGRVISFVMLLALIPLVKYWGVWGVITCRVITSFIVSSVMLYIFYSPGDRELQVVRT